MAFESGALLGDYHVLGPIGAGGMGSVYKVRNTVSDRIEALKVLLPNLQAEPQLEERFLREIRVLARLAHPNIAALHTAFRMNNQLLMVMEFVEGAALPEVLRRGRLPMADCIDYATQTLSAVAYAHGMGVVHRDIKPSNMMITPQGVVKLLDFGIASVAAEKKLTRTGMVMGSLHYMSPEQVQARPVDARSDVYSLGVTFYEMMTGRCPIEGDSDYAVMAAHIHAVPIPPSQLEPRVPEGMSAVLMKALEKDPSSRFVSASDFLAAFSAAAQRVPAEPAAAAPSPMTRTMFAPPTPVPASAAGTADRQAMPLDQPAIDAIAKELAVYIGPIARIVVRKAAARCATRAQLQDQVAAEIGNPQDRAKFLAAAKRIRTGTTRPG
ncbi:MAG TPA: serine/threonine-protein kinase [Bryobacteraceae bacterium]|nr:serine/threonine-protein kinase [Bryobacteraceae bacterium]